MVLFVRKPQQYFSPIIREYITFCLFSGLQINWEKSVIIPLTDITTPPHVEFPLIWADTPMKLLGV